MAAPQKKSASQPGLAALLQRAGAHHRRGQLDEAEALYRQVLAAAPQYFDAPHLCGVLMQQRGRSAEALALIGEALACNDTVAAAHCNYGLVLAALGRSEEALASYERALALKPHYAEAHYNRGNALRELGRLADALIAFDRALALKPDYAEAHNNRGNAALELNRIGEALADYECALALKPDHAEALVNRGNALRFAARPAEAIASFDRVLALNPQLPEAYWNKGLTCLSIGDFARGWAGYEWRWRRSDTEMTPREFAQPQWLGEDLGGRTVLLHAEQGFGDTIQFIRYLPMIIARGGKVVFEVPEDLRPLIPHSDGVVTLARREEPLPPFDLHCPLMSLAGAFGTTLATIPAQVPYLQAPAGRLEKMRSRLTGATHRPGLVGQADAQERPQP